MVEFAAWCQSVCTAPVKLAAGAYQIKEMFENATEVIVAADVASYSKEAFPVNFTIHQRDYGYRLGVPIPHAQKAEFHTGQSPNEMRALDFAIDVGLAMMNRTRGLTLLDTVHVISHSKSWNGKVMRRALVSASYDDASSCLTTPTATNTIGDAIRRLADEAHEPDMQDDSTVTESRDKHRSVVRKTAPKGVIIQQAKDFIAQVTEQTPVQATTNNGNGSSASIASSDITSDARASFSSVTGNASTSITNDGAANDPNDCDTTDHNPVREEQRVRCLREGCGRWFNSVCYLRIHLGEMHNFATADGRYPCPISAHANCDESFDTTEDAVEHLYAHPEMRIPCPYAELLGCPNTFLNMRSTKKCRSSHKRLPDGTFSCKFRLSLGSKQTFKTTADRFGHHRTHAEHNKHKCVVAECKKSCRSAPSLAGHIRNDHPGRVSKSTRRAARISDSDASRADAR